MGQVADTTSNRSSLRCTLSVVVLAVEEIVIVKDFLLSLFGWPVGVDEPDYCELEAAEDMTVALYQRDSFLAILEGRHVLPAGPGGMPVELYVKVEDARALVERACALGAKLLSPATVRYWGTTVGYVAIPGGCVLALSSASHQEG